MVRSGNQPCDQNGRKEVSDHFGREEFSDYWFGRKEVTSDWVLWSEVVVSGFKL